MPPNNYGMTKDDPVKSMPTVGEEKYMISSNIQQDICLQLAELYKIMDESYEKAIKLKGTLTDDVWMGESKDQFILLLEAVSKHHELLKKALAQNKYAIDNIDEIVAEHFENSKILSLLEV